MASMYLCIFFTVIFLNRADAILLALGGGLALQAKACPNERLWR